MTFKLLNGDCMELFKDIKDNSIDLILCDPPYGTFEGFNEQDKDNNRNFVGIEKDKHYFEIAKDRIENADNE